MISNQVISVFTRHGIADATQIAEHISFLLLAEHTDKNWRDNAAHWPNLEEEIKQELDVQGPEPPPLSAWEGRTPHDLIATFETLLDSLDDNWGGFYQREARFQLLSSDRPGEYYPTPHHIADFMAQLILLPNASGTVYDPTCGSAGLLVAAKKYAKNIQPIGTDYNGRWARLGVTNLYLNGVSQPQIEARSAQSFRNEHPETQYDYVLMNPPFAAGVVDELLKLAIDSLNDDGRAALLIPSGIVQRGSDTLLDGSNLSGIITLPPDAMQPYNGIRAHVIVIDKQRQLDQAWLALLLSDGYGSGRSRPIDQPEPPQPSELPRTISLIQALQDDADWQTIWQDDEKSILSRQTDSYDNHPAGVAFQARGEWASISWQIVLLGDGALVWLGDGPPQTADIRLLANYVSATHAMEEKVACQWTQITASKVTEMSEWEVSDSSPKIKVTINDNQLKISQDNLTFISQGDAEGMGACLLDDEGQRISAWYWHSSKETLPDKLIKKGQLLYDANGKPCGYQISLSSGDEDNATLLLTLGSTISLWQLGSDQVGLIWNEDDTGGTFRLNDRLITDIGKRMKTRLQRADKQARGIAFGPHVDANLGARLFAVCIPETLLYKNETLEPERYLPEVRETAVQLPPTKILASIRRNQDQLSQRVDWLLQTLSEANNQPDKMPEGFYGLEKYFDTRQLDIWQEINDNDGKFTLDDLVQWGSMNEPEISHQLDLLVLLGWIVPVNQNGQNQYRLTGAADLFEAQDE